MQVVLENGHGERREHIGDCSKARDCSAEYDTDNDKRKHVRKFGSRSDSEFLVPEMGKAPALVEYLMLYSVPVVPAPEMLPRQRSDFIDPFGHLVKNNRHYGAERELLYWYILEQRYRYKLCSGLMCNKKRCHRYR